MSSADQSELHQDTALSLAASRANGVQIPGSDILSPLASRSLFWRARYLEASPALCHIPLLFWLTEAARPRIAVTLGVADAVPHFALCQAVDKLGLESLCIGVEPAPEQGAKPADLKKQTAFNEANFAEFSQIVQDSEAKEGILPPKSKIDLLLINRPVTEELIGTLDANWLPLLSERSIIVVLQDGDASGYGSFFRRLSSTGDSFTCDLASRASVIFYGPEQNERLQRLARLNPGHPGYLGARNIFARLGELHSNAERLAFKNREAATARRQRDEKNAELAAAQAAADKLSAQYKERSALVATAQAEAFDLGQTVTRLEQDLKDSEAKRQQDKELLGKELGTLKESFAAAQAECQRLQQLAAEAEAAAQQREAAQQENELLSQEVGTLKESLAAAQAEHQKMRQKAAEQEKTLTERYDDIAVLGNELQAKAAEAEEAAQEREAARQESELLSQELSSLKKSLGAAQAERQKLQLLAAEQEESLAERYADIAVLGNELQTKAAEAEKAAAEREALRQENEALQQRLNEAEQLRDMHAERIQALEHSTSWRVTAPLRKVSLAVKPQ